MIALIDNYDSFTYNIYHYLSEYCEVRVFRNTEGLDSLKGLDIKGLVISPGPSHPANSLLSLDAIDYFRGKVPMLGICLGMQAMAYHAGDRVRKARSVMHGKVDTMENYGGVLFKGIGRTFPAVRYHSLVVENDRKNFSTCAISASDGEIMAIENAALKMFGLQFHPESYSTKNGMLFIKNFVEVCNGGA
ncbi:MAG: Aminodeoxychorismate/anthranilate synthase component 2 [Syntrophorhabdus sp. PtaU1.Bin058]|nr:MAG: Aminodeoxychorismate/anthranilate synthase component 2 [Syntrophorhabdus sp. PtaU1.Bin058]